MALFETISWKRQKIRKRSRGTHVSPKNKTAAKANPGRNHQVMSRKKIIANKISPDVRI